jgi:uncharacterized protein
VRHLPRHLALVVCLLLAPLTAAAQEPVIPPARGFVNDHAGVLDESTAARLEGFLDQVRRKTGAEFAVLTVQSTAPLTPTEYKVRVFDAWKLGAKGEDNGLLLLVAVAEREVRFETGYGLEGALPDGLQSRIFRREMQPRFREGDFSGGITAGVLACAERIAAEKGVTLEWDGQELRYGDGGEVPPWLPIVVFLIVVIVIRIAARSGRRRRRGWWYMGPGGHGGWGGGFGGFGGGGGGGGSFGGFSGGSSGGGGGGGSW